MLIGMALLIGGHSSHTCTRVVYKGPEQTIITARSMDWRYEMTTNLWIFPRGIQRTGEVGPNSLKWTSKYGSVIASSYDFSTSDGMNEEGLVANVLWLVESEYPQWDPNKPGMSAAIWTQYVLDSFATVAEAVEELQQENFVLVSDQMPGTDQMANIHLSISDSYGDNAIFEYIKGKLVIHHDSSYTVLTNSPVFEEQLAIRDYWQKIGGTTFLPGANRAADRFVRASFYNDVVPKTDNMQVALASAFSIIRNTSVPYGISMPDEPNISTTRWRTVSDHKNRVYYFESTLYPVDVLWVNFDEVDFSPNAPIRKLDLSGKMYTGNATKEFKASAPFKFMGL